MRPSQTGTDIGSRSLTTIRREAGASAFMTGLTESFMIPYALALQASAFEAGLLSSCRNLVLSLVQLKSADAVEWLHSRRRLVIRTAVVQALLWVPLAIVGPLCGSWAVIVLITLYTLGSASAAFGGPVWGSMVSELLPPEQRGRFFGRLTFVAGGCTAFAALLAGGTLHVTAATPLVGFGLLCVGAALSRAVSCLLLVRVPETPLEHDGQARFSFWQFVRQTPTSNFARFALSVGVFNFSVHLAGAYLAVYMLQDLQYGYLTYTGIVQAGAVAGFLAGRRWGRVTDRLGNRAVLRWAMLGASVLPALWPLSRHPLWLLAVYVLGGCVWGGFNIAVVNFVYDAAVPPKRARCLAYFNVINGCGVSLGALTGGYLLGLLPAIQGSAFVTLFYASAALRGIAAILFFRSVREVRPVQALGLRHLMYDLVGQRLVNVLSLPGAATGRRTEQREGRHRGPGGRAGPGD